MNITQNQLFHIIDKLERGMITADQANIEKVLVQRVLVINGRFPMAARKALNAAVKDGVLGHMKKQGMKPEVYYNPTFDYLARSERKKIERDAIQAIATVAGFKGTI